MKARVVSGMRPTGQLHLGHLVGALSNWVPLQEQYDCFYFVADWHALTSEYAAMIDKANKATGADKDLADQVVANMAYGLIPSGPVRRAVVFGGPAYLALIPTLVGKEDLQNAIALTSIQFNLARVVGPALGGVARAMERSAPLVPARRPRGARARGAKLGDLVARRF